LSGAVVALDVGGTSTKAVRVDPGTGAFRSKRWAQPTPTPATVEDVVSRARAGVDHLARPDEPLGVALPAIVRSGVTYGPGLGPDWDGADVARMFSDRAGPVECLNDADAAGIAELRLGAARGTSGTVILLTLGTGIGSALIHDGRLIPNTELGLLEYQGRPAERGLSARSRESRGLGWEAWATEFSGYLTALHGWFDPSLFLLSGGLTNAADRFLAKLAAPVPVRLARFGADAGLIGAALVAADATSSGRTFG
jgi:polyphosphate glucokinase